MDHLLPLVSVIIVTWNSQATIRNCIDSLYLQRDISKIEIIVVDNGSTDGTIKEVRKNADIKVLRNKSNFGFCAANNQGVNISTGDYILFLNPDAVLGDDYLGNLIRVIEKDHRIALITGKIFLMHEDGNPVLLDGKQMIDSVGIKLERNRQAVDIGNCEVDQSQFEKPCEVFGVSGAVCLSRKRSSPRC